MHHKPLREMRDQARQAVEQLQTHITTALETFNDQLYERTDIRIYDGWLIASVIEQLEEIAKIATMERANFGGIPGWNNYEIAPGVKMTPEQKEAARILFGEGGNPTVFIKQATKLWRESWIVRPLQHYIEILKTAQHKG